MAKQNIYDNKLFFDGYKQIREHAGNANNVFEEPALFSLLPDLGGKTVIDLGCGFGGHCTRFIQKGARKVTGIDISKKMLEIANAENSHPDITYLNMPMEDITELDETFDVAVSSLAIHYTCFSGGDRWTRDENGEKIFANISNYGMDGERDTVWFVDHVKKYHRTFSTIINTLIEAGFSVEKLIEPVPTREILEKYPEYADLFHKPDFLLVKARKL